MKKPRTILLIAGLLLGAILGLPLLIGIWLPDMISAPRRIITEERIASGDSFRVIQYWNRVDFYTTELLHTAPDGTVATHLLDGDDNKSWSGRLDIDEQHKTATVTFDAGRVKMMDW